MFLIVNHCILRLFSERWDGNESILEVHFRKFGLRAWVEVVFLKKHTKLLLFSAVGYLDIKEF